MVHSASSGARFVGRSRELAQAVDALSRPDSILVVEGEPGIGKTRLLREVLRAPAVAPLVRLPMACPPLDEPFPFGPVVDALRRRSIEGLELTPLAGALRPLFPEWSAYLPETPPLYPEMRVRAYLEYVARIKEVPRARRRSAVDRAIERCALTGVSRQVIATLSMGYRQRVGLAQAIVHEPAVLILDEPTRGLDPLQVREIRGLIAELVAPEQGESQHTVILSTHILPEVEAICRRVILIHAGRKAVDAPLGELVSGGRSLEEIFARETARDAAAVGDRLCGSRGRRRLPGGGAL